MGETIEAAVALGGAVAGEAAAMVKTPAVEDFDAIRAAMIAIQQREGRPPPVGPMRSSDISEEGGEHA